MALVVDVEAIRSWLTARYDEDQADAEYAHTPGRWMAAGRVGEPNLVEAYVVVDDDSDDPAEVTPDLIWRSDAVHIANWSPARVQVEIAAKRRRLERHALGGFTNVTQSPFCGWCTEGYNGRTSEPDAPVLIVPWPCPDIIDDAQAYRDHAGFPAELRLP